jgi:MSHA biogenesis protein MshP
MASSFIRTGDRGQRCCRGFAATVQQSARSADKNLSSVFCPLSSERGFSLVSAIFLLVVIAALGVFSVTLFTAQQQSAALDVMGARAYQAARAGIEWGTYQVLPNSAVPGGFAANCRTGAISQPVAPLPNTLAGFSVNVQCVSTAHSEASATVTIYQMTSTATRGAPAASDYVERQIQATIAQ